MNQRVAFFLYFIATTVSAAEINGQARVLDGDSLRIGKVEIRLFGIDAPESRQTCKIDGQLWECGRSAARALVEMTGSTTVRCTWSERDTYARALATCFVDGTNLNAKLVAHGMALAYTQYSTRYAPEQATARAAAKGLWRSEFIAPWTWRRTNPSTHRRPKYRSVDPES